MFAVLRGCDESLFPIREYDNVDTNIQSVYRSLGGVFDSSLEVRMFYVLSATRSGALVAGRQAFVAFVLLHASCVVCHLPGITVRTAVF